MAAYAQESTIGNPHKSTDEWITIIGAHLHNLKNISLSIPKKKLVVLTGLSGSGKSTLAFDTLHKEGQRQYLESLGMVDYSGKPNVERIIGLSPSISVDQSLSNRSPRSTVGTVTEVYTFLRVLFARLGERPCPSCGKPVPPDTDINGSEALEDDNPGMNSDTPFDFETSYPCPHCGASLPVLGMAHFSFNKPAGACPTCTGLGVVNNANLNLLIDPKQSVMDGGVVRWDIHEIKRYSKTMQNAGQYYGFEFDPNLPIAELGQIQTDLLLHGVHSQIFRKHFPDTEPPETVSKGRFEGVVPNLLRRYEEHATKADYRQKMEKLLVQQTCPDCEGSRLREESRQMSIKGHSIIDLAHMPLSELAQWLKKLPEQLSSEERLIGEAIITDLNERLYNLLDVGVEYLTLERGTPSLSAGETQRLRLAALLGSGLTGVLYVLDEPTMGLHQRDTQRLIAVLKRLRDLGNTVLVVEHDLDVIRAADYVIDIGPGAGQYGGEIIATGSPQEIAASETSLTGHYLNQKTSLPQQTRPIKPDKQLVIKGARLHNLKNLTVNIPLGVLTVVSGVSGSGKSSLMLDILGKAARQHYYGTEEQPGEHDSIEGWSHLDSIIMVDQHSIGRTTRSNAATYTDVFSSIRQIFAERPEAKKSRLNASHFSFNVVGGRCERCKGVGTLTVNMHFLPDVQVRCPSCHGKRFKRQVLDIHYQGFNIDDVLRMTIEEAAVLFKDVPAAANRLKLMIDVGLGYLVLGQPATTLSGGEAQRIKLAKELSRVKNGRTLYLLDEPTTGLHPHDVDHLLDVLQRLVNNGSTVIVIEHNLDIIRSADWIIDLGPEGGLDGGKIIAEGTPMTIAQHETSQTGIFLRKTLQQR